MSALAVHVHAAYREWMDKKHIFRYRFYTISKEASGTVSIFRAMPAVTTCTLSVLWEARQPGNSKNT
jgi:hypothetical protein